MLSKLIVLVSLIFMAVFIYCRVFTEEIFLSNEILVAAFVIAVIKIGEYVWGVRRGKR